MDQPVGTVLSVSDHSAVVRVRGPVCARCASGKGCGAGLVGSSRAPLRVEAAIADGVTVRVGERVVLGLEDGRLLRAAGYLYGLPLAGLLAASGLAFLAGIDSDALVVAFALSGLAAGATLGRTLVRRDACVRRLMPTIDAKVTGAGT